MSSFPPWWYIGNWTFICIDFSFQSLYGEKFRLGGGQSRIINHIGIIDVLWRGDQVDQAGRRLTNAPCPGRRPLGTTCPEKSCAGCRGCVVGRPRQLALMWKGGCGNENNRNTVNLRKQWNYYFLLSFPLTAEYIAIMLMLIITLSKDRSTVNLKKAKEYLFFNWIFFLQLGILKSWC